MRPTPSNLLDFQRSTTPCATGPDLTRGVDIDLAHDFGWAGVEIEASDNSCLGSAGANGARGTESRSLRLPDPRTVHLDDIRAELEHGRIGASLRDSRPMSLGAWAVMLMAVAVVCVVVAL